MAACAEGGDDPDIASTDSAASEVTATCPTASAGKPTYLFWHTTRQLEHLVWSSDGQQVGAVEYIFEERKSWNPLNGTTDKRKFCHQLSIHDKNLKFQTTSARCSRTRPARFRSCSPPATSR